MNFKLKAGFLLIQEVFGNDLPIRLLSKGSESEKMLLSTQVQVLIARLLAPLIRRISDLLLCEERFLSIRHPCPNDGLWYKV